LTEVGEQPRLPEGSPRGLQYEKAWSVGRAQSAISERL